MSNVAGLDIVCPSCGESYHMTTDEYVPGVSPHGGMMVLRPMYGECGLNWSSFPCTPDSRDSDLECPGCGGCYVTSDGLKTRAGTSGPGLPNAAASGLVGALRPALTGVAPQDMAYVVSPHENTGGSSAVVVSDDDIGDDDFGSDCTGRFSE